MYQREITSKINDIRESTGIEISIERRADSDVNNWGSFLVFAENNSKEWQIWQGSYKSCQTFVCGLWSMSEMTRTDKA